MSVGNVVYGSNYFPRPKDERVIWRKLAQGDHLLLLAPRRVGKSSLIHRLKDNPKEGYALIYSYVQDCTDEQEFYRKLLKSITQSEFVTNTASVSTKVKGWFSKLDIDFSVEAFGVKVAADKKNTHEPCVINTDIIRQILMDSLSDTEITLIIAIDEFPDVLINIHKQHGEMAAIKFLSGIREICQDIDFNKKVRFIFTGSIGLDTVAKKLNLSNLINVFVHTTINPLSALEAKNFIDFYFNKSSERVLSDNLKSLIIEQVGWNMPYYLALVCEEILDNYEDDQLLEEQDVVSCIDQLFQQETKTKFSHWRERLNRLEKLERIFAESTLTLVSEHSGALPYSEIFNLSQHEDYKDHINASYVLTCLKHEGYLYHSENDTYQFTSPLLKRWWIRYGK